jgi:hypothetical protein
VGRKNSHTTRTDERGHATCGNPICQPVLECVQIMPGSCCAEP